MRLLIDTHALIWVCDGRPSLSEVARAAMEDDSNERFISHAVPWEMAVKLALGKPLWSREIKPHCEGTLTFFKAH